jgi:hypothetical protein
MLELEHYREYATTVERDGREFVLVRIPDRYELRERTEPQIQLHRSRKRP